MSIRDIVPLAHRKRSPAAADFFGRLHAELDQTFEKFFDRLPFAHQEETLGLPAVDMSETDEVVEIKVDLPGLAKEDISLELQNNTLYISGERKTEREEKKKNYRLVERSHGAFTRSVTLPAEVIEEDVQASFADGVLTVTLPKSEDAVRSKKKIPIKAA